MSHWRYITVGCQRVWHWFARVGPAERPASVLYPCAKAALIFPPLLGIPSSMSPFPVGGWPEQYPSEYAAGFRGVPSPAGRNNAPQPGEGLLAVPGPNIVSVNETPPFNVPPFIHTPPVDYVNIPPAEHIPEPSSLVVLAVGAGAAVLVKRWRA